MNLDIPAQRTPASLTQPGARTGRRCPSCAGSRLTELEMTLTDGSRVHFLSCHACEHRGWSQAGDALGLDTVLAKAHKPR